MQQQIVQLPKCMFCRRPVGTDAVPVRLGGKLLGVAHPPHAALAMKVAITARKYGPAFLRGFLQARYPKGFGEAQKLYAIFTDALEATRDT